ncbi:hypothetical protein CO112_02450 [Candidatus Dojkabacteria bacterium CG_4_9_14_3_um_filter_150_Dojkabacteria_WS6_41_13]|uniref:Glycosyltransferase 2-like domain-containing protein n=1 Tax=Candidatus Dojkabacteria bacterium CG_4_10_14_0_2_um_filter_Dojkabacteria_WS6_41_15 TaxID=2014249 RepID=A0A2M7W0X9_9BACT|nr:MAG: hypothetical protein COZ14_00535 [Candidatus Dojkabacteria bacterium CG_4_10_14_3_um_filter_Dojkabacteria_WS6_41_9]PJA12623.1 MAG: hypothetical protein COX64_04310 [Candidatus Dojkabacteria bacterium CG_4_10_14_0_2_um_filter_Dojkabacteria_WS6_41_15]PJB22787.1 MAG: hypothetical protein CO112_02450 [Candidatus Dojkabacteria bacterium CG_4_9_14_3_um_filter_150_Dojkabacteria_WS6_41_13]
MKHVYNFDSPFFKIVRVIPGLITLALLLSPIWATLIGRPKIVLYYVAFLSVYWLYKTTVTSLGNIIGFRRYKRALELDWDSMIKKLDWKDLPNPEQLPKSFKDLQIVVLIPYTKELYEVIQDTIESVKRSTFDLKKIHILVGIEGRGGEYSKQTGDRLVADYSQTFAEVNYYIHPADIAGEAFGIAGPNLAWATREYVKDVRARGEDISNYQVIKYDSDMLIHPKFLSNYIHTYLMSADRYYSFFSPAVMLYSNNYWEVPFLVRVFSGALTLALLSEWVVAKKQKQSFSCYGFNLKLLDEIDYFDPQIGVDDTGFYWRAVLATDGHFKGEEFYAPCYNDAVLAETYAKSHVVMYKQLRRWGWGAIVYPMTIQGITNNRKISFKKKVQSMVEMFRVYNLYSTLVFLLSFSIPMIMFLNPDFGLSSSAHVLPKIVSTLMTISLLGLLPSRSVLEALYGPPPKKKGLVFFLWHYFEQIMLILFSLTLGFFPYLQAQIEMMLGLSMTFMVTPKHRNK